MKGLMLIAALLVTGCAAHPVPIIRAPFLTQAENDQGCAFVGWGPYGESKLSGPSALWEYIDAKGKRRWAGGLLNMQCPDYRSMKGRQMGETIIVSQRFCISGTCTSRGVYEHGVLVGCRR